MKKLSFIAVALLVVCSCLCSCSSSSSTPAPTSPEPVLEAFLDAMKSKDYTKAQTFTNIDKEDWADYIEDFKSGDCRLDSYTFVSVDADIKVEMKGDFYGDKEESERFYMNKEDGQWVIDLEY